MPLRTMALPAFQLLEKLSSVQNAFNRNRSLRRNAQRSSRFLFGPARGPCFYECHKISALLRRQRTPRRHVRRHEPAGNSVIEVFISGQSARGGGAAFKRRFGEIPGLRIDPRCVHSKPVAVLSVAAYTIPAIKALPALRVSG